MNVSGVGQAVNIWLLKQTMQMAQVQAIAPATQQAVDRLAAMDPSRGQNLDISV